MGRYQYSGGSRCCVSNCSARNRCKNEKTDTKIFSTKCNGKILKFCLKHLQGKCDHIFSIVGDYSG